MSQHGYQEDDLAGLRRMLRFCGLLTVALNTAGAISRHQYGTAPVDTVGPALLIGWAEVGPWLLQQIYAICRETAPERPALQQPEAAPQITPDPPPRQLARARELDAGHRAETGRPISRDALRSSFGSAGTGPATWSAQYAPKRPPQPDRPCNSKPPSTVPRRHHARSTYRDRGSEVRSPPPEESLTSTRYNICHW